MGFVSFHANDLDEAAMWFHRSVEIAPSDASSVKSLATVYSKQASIRLHGAESYANAVKWSETYLRMEPNDHLFMMDLVAIYFRIGNTFTDALRWTERALAIG